MENLGFIAVPAITIICYLGAEIYKLFINNNERLLKATPVVCGVLGGILGLLTFIFFPTYIIADNLIGGIAVGIISGFASTGINQLYKQYTKDK